MAVYSAEMSRARGSTCADANALAAYVDRQLDDDTTARLEAHLASCAECTELIAEALSVGDSVAPRVVFQDEPAVVGGWARRIVRGGAATAAIVAALILPELAGSRRDSKLADLAVAAGARWPVEGRLTGGIPHSSLNAPLAGGQGGAVGDPVRVQLVAGKIREDLDARGTPERLHAFGLSQLLLGRLDAASVALTAAAREQPHNAGYQSDAAALYLERARTGQHPEDLPRALAAAERARVADPSGLEGRFNRALALERLSLSARARQAWTEYLERDRSSSWAEEARSHLAALNSPTRASRWSRVEARLRQGSVDASLAEEAVRAHMTGARTLLETELWTEWAEAVERGDESRERESLRAMAAALAHIGGDDLYSHAVEAIDRAARRGSASLRRLAAAHRAYAVAASLAADDRFADAAAGLAAARSEFAAAGSAFVTLVDFELARVAYFKGTTEQVTRALASLGTLAQAKQYTHIAGRVSWMQGLMAFAQGRYGDVRVSWESTLTTFERMGDSEQIVAAHNLLANLYFSLGDSQAAWQQRAQAMRALSASTSPRIRHAILTSAAAQALGENLPEAALLLQNEVIENSRIMGRPAATADALILRAGIAVELNQVEQAWIDLRAARAYLAAIPEAVLRDRRESDILSLESELTRAANAAEAVRLATRAIDLSPSERGGPRLAALWLRRAKAERAAGRRDQASRSAARGIEAFTRDRARLAQAGGTSRDDEAWELFEVAMRLALDQRDTAKAFAFAAASRHRDPSSATRADTLAAQVQRELLAGEAVVAFNQLDDELFVWVVTSSTVEVLKRPLQRSEAERLVARHRDEVDLELFRPRATAALFNELVRPLGDRLNNVDYLMVVPDAPYYNVAFSALWDRNRDRFVVEDRSVSVLSDVGSLSQCKARHTRKRAAGHLR